MVFNPDEEEENTETLEQIISRKHTAENLIYSNNFFDREKKDFSEKKKNMSYSGNLKDFLRKKSMTDRKKHSTSIFFGGFNDKKVERKISESFNFIKPKKKNIPFERKKSNKSITNNFIMMNIKPSHKRNQEKVEKKKNSKSPKLKKIIFNQDKKKLSQSPSNKKTNIIQRSKSNILQTKLDKNINKKNQYIENVLENITRPLNLKMDIIKKISKPKILIEEENIKEPLQNKNSELVKDFAFNIILNNIEMRIKYEELKQKQDMINFEYNNSISETNSFLNNRKFNTNQNSTNQNSITNDIYSRKSRESNLTEKTEYLKKQQNVYSNYKKKQLKMSFDQKVEKSMLPSKTLDNLLKNKYTKTREHSPQLDLEEIETYKKFEKAKRIVDNSMSDKYSFNCNFGRKDYNNTVNNLKNKNNQIDSIRKIRKEIKNDYFDDKKIEEKIKIDQNKYLKNTLVDEYLEKKKVHKNHRRISLSKTKNKQKNNLLEKKLLQKNIINKNINNLLAHNKEINNLIAHNKEILEKKLKLDNININNNIKKNIIKKDYLNNYRSTTPFQKYKKYNLTSKLENNNFDENIYQNIKEKKEKQNLYTNYQNESDDEFVKNLQPKLISEKNINFKNERRSMDQRKVISERKLINKKNLDFKNERKKEFWSNVKKVDNLEEKRISTNPERVSNSKYNYGDRIFVREENGRKIYRLNLK